MSFATPPASTSPDFSERGGERKMLSEYLSSSSVIALNHAIEERVRNCLFASEKTGKSYFDELLSILSYIPAGKDFSYTIQKRKKTFPPQIPSQETVKFYFPEGTIGYIEKEVQTLNIFEKKLILT